MSKIQKVKEQPLYHNLENIVEFLESRKQKQISLYELEKLRNLKDILNNLKIFSQMYHSNIFYPTAEKNAMQNDKSPKLLVDFFNKLANRISNFIQCCTEQINQLRIRYFNFNYDMIDICSCLSDIIFPFFGSKNFIMLSKFEQCYQEFILIEEQKIHLEQRITNCLLSEIENFFSNQQQKSTIVKDNDLTKFQSIKKICEKFQEFHIFQILLNNQSNYIIILYQKQQFSSVQSDFTNLYSFNNTQINEKFLKKVVEIQFDLNQNIEITSRVNKLASYFQNMLFENYHSHFEQLIKTTFSQIFDFEILMQQQNEAIQQQQQIENFIIIDDEQQIPTQIKINKIIYTLQFPYGICDSVLLKYNLEKLIMKYEQTISEINQTKQIIQVLRKDKNNLIFIFDDNLKLIYQESTIPIFFRSFLNFDYIQQQVQKSANVEINLQNFLTQNQNLSSFVLDLVQNLKQNKQKSMIYHMDNTCSLEISIIKSSQNFIVVLKKCKQSFIQNLKLKQSQQLKKSEDQKFQDKLDKIIKGFKISYEFSIQEVVKILSKKAAEKIVTKQLLQDEHQISQKNRKKLKQTIIQEYMDEKYQKNTFISFQHHSSKLNIPFKNQNRDRSYTESHFQLKNFNKPLISPYLKKSITRNLNKTHKNFNQEDNELQISIMSERQKSDTEESLYIDPDFPLQFEKDDLEKLCKWSQINALELKYADMKRYSYQILKLSKFLSYFQIEDDVFKNFLNQIQISYDYNKNPFHNFRHAFTVFHSVFYLLRKENAYKELDEIKQYSLLLSALCHDVDHSGRTNNFEQSKLSNLAITYNDQSILENHHIAQTFNILISNNEMNILGNCSEEEFRKMRKYIINNILATDMKKHFKLIEEMVSMNFDQKFGNKEEDEQLLICQLIIHSSDLYSAAKPFEISKKWAMLINQEFTNQVREEQELNLPITKYYQNLDDPIVLANGEINFIQVIVQPLWFQTNRLLQNQISEIMNNIQQNIEEWKKILQEHQDKNECNQNDNQIS